MRFHTLIIPAGDGETLIDPPLADYGGLIGQNRALARDAAIDGEPLATLAAEARKLALDDAAAYTRNLGFDPGADYDPEGPVIVSGHQPVVFHPGVAVKQFALVRQAAALGAAPIFISVDSDEFKAGAIPVPAIVEGRLLRRERELFPQYPHGRKALFETASVEPAEKLKERLLALEEDFNHPRLAAPSAAFRGFLDRLKGARLDGEDFTSRSIALRRAWAGGLSAGGPLDLPVSRLSRHRPFHAFALDILRRIESFADMYNTQLRRYRDEHKLRYPANPFPDLEADDGRIETPFWLVGGGFRQRLYAHVDSSGDVALSGETEGRWTAAGIENGSIAIRPRAIVLSIYLRLFLSDLFIHGVGGAKYDTITDAIIERFYGLTPPAFSLVTATAWVGAEAADPRERIDQVKEALRDLEHHPETLDLADEKLQKLSEEKRRLVESIGRFDADKRALGARIGELNREMSARLAPERERLATELSRLLEEEQERQAAQARDYPMFFYDPERIEALLG